MHNYFPDREIRNSGVKLSNSVRPSNTVPWLNSIPRKNVWFKCLKLFLMCEFTFSNCLYFYTHIQRKYASYISSLSCDNEYCKEFRLLKNYSTNLIRKEKKKTEKEEKIGEKRVNRNTETAVVNSLIMGIFRASLRLLTMRVDDVSVKDFCTTKNGFFLTNFFTRTTGSEIHDAVNQIEFALYPFLFLIIDWQSLLSFTLWWSRWR